MKKKTFKNDDQNILSAGGYPKKEKKRSPSLCVVFPEEMLTKIRKKAFKENITAGELVRRYCAKGLKKWVKKKRLYGKKLLI